jgi:Peptidase A4 family
VLKLAVAALLVLAGAAVAGGAAAAPAHLSFAGRSATDNQVSSNWAGYAAIAPEGGSLTFANATATWVVPKVKCVAGRSDAVAFWVGLGGYSADSQSLEQLGTAATCNGVQTVPTYYAWWEIVPAASVQMSLKVKPGDTVTAAVAVDGQQVTMSLKDVTRRSRFSKVQTVSQPLDVTSAEWIAEAPARCTSTNHCRVLKLSNFGGVTFSNIAATGNAHPGTLADDTNTWVTTPITLVPDSTGSSFFEQADPLGSSVGAVPGVVSTDGRSFGVTWQQRVTLPTG